MEQPNLAVMESDLRNLGEIVHELAGTVKDQRLVVQDLILNARLMQQSQVTNERKLNEEIFPKVSELWENRSAVKGGYAVVSLLGGIIVGAATVISIVKTLH